MRNRFCSLLIVVSVIMLTACSQKVVPNAADAINITDKSGEYARKVDNFLVIFDSSSSMFDNFNGQSKFAIAKDTVVRFNKSIPNLDMQSGLRVYGPNIPSAKGYNSLIYGMTKYSSAEMQGAIDRITGTAGTSPLSMALTRAASDLDAVRGKIAIIIITDGLVDEEPVLTAAESLKIKFANRLCIYPILVGDSMTGKATLDKIVDVAGCGAAYTAGQIATARSMADYARTIFYSKIADSDGDGVNNAKDKCPNTPKGVAVDAAGCPFDSDRDGVYDYLDKCPGTPRGITVDKNGCPVPIPETLTINLLVEFEFNKAAIRSQYHGEIEKFANFMRAYPQTKTVIEAHTDNIGSENYNMKLSQRRADSVIQYLVKNFGIDGNRLSAKGFGFSKPIADNNTETGRQRNRRVEAAISTTVMK